MEKIVESAVSQIFSDAGFDRGVCGYTEQVKKFYE